MSVTDLGVEGVLWGVGRMESSEGFGVSGACCHFRKTKVDMLTLLMIGMMAGFA